MDLDERYRDVWEIASVSRQRAGIVIERYSVYGVEGFVNEPPPTSEHCVLS
jgi:hypothetical protein